jgi:hypothetical protein
MFFFRQFSLLKKFWEEVIAYFTFTLILVFDTTNRKKTLVCIRNENNKSTFSETTVLL